MKTAEARPHPVRRLTCAGGPRAGFTVCELMVVVGIAAVLAAIAVPDFIGWQQAGRLNAAADDVLFLLKNARLRAVKENAPVVVLFDPGRDGRPDGDYLAFVDDRRSGDSRWTHEPESEPVVDRGQLPAGIAISGTQFAGHRLRFNSRGQLMNGNKSIFLCDARQRMRRIQLYVSGHARIVERVSNR